MFHYFEKYDCTACLHKQTIVHVEDGYFRLKVNLYCITDETKVYI